VALVPTSAVSRLAAGATPEEILSRAAAVDASPGWAVSVTSRSSLAAARRRLLQSVRKDTDGFVSRHFNRPVSLQLTRMFIALHATPNQISVLGLATGLAGAWAASRGGYRPILAGAALFQLASVLDGSDGEVARLTGRQSPLGSWLDTLCDELTCLAFFTALPLGLHRQTRDPVHLLLGGIMLAAAGTLFLLMVRHLRRAGEQGSMVRLLDEFREAGDRRGPGGLASRTVARLSFAVRRDFFSMAILVLCAVGLASAVVWTLALALVSGVAFFGWFSLLRRRG
jgi:CDP-L-myo-inositol myo-inositolphosphotransferase